MGQFAFGILNGKNSFGAVLIAATLLATALPTASAKAAGCEPGAVSYKKSIRLALRYFVADASNVLMSKSSGSLRISVVNNEVFKIVRNGYQSQITIRSGYHNVADSFGVRVRKATFLLETNSSCDDFKLLSLSAEPKIGIGHPDVDLSRSAFSALEHFVDHDVFPMNRHSGDFSLRVHPAELCVGGDVMNINIVRSNQQPSGIAYAVTSALVELKTGRVVNATTVPGKFLRSLCP